ncbi:hypothetical protein H0H93_006173 [Arthromyces matolae]|nr:hypothetical protein H0H93_006173 [Arthromyces matolae]
MESSDISEEEKTERKDSFEKLQTIIAHWYRYKMTTINNGKMCSHVQDILATFREMSMERPQKQTPQKPEEFRQALQDECDAMYKAQMDKYKNGKTWQPRMAIKYEQ